MRNSRWSHWENLLLISILKAGTLILIQISYRGRRRRRKHLLIILRLLIQNRIGMRHRRGIIVSMWDFLVHSSRI